MIHDYYVPMSRGRSVGIDAAVSKKFPYYGYGKPYSLVEFLAVI